MGSLTVYLPASLVCTLFDAIYFSIGVSFGARCILNMDSKPPAKRRVVVTFGQRRTD
jgi:hypothetical protein